MERIIKIISNINKISKISAFLTFVFIVLSLAATASNLKIASIKPSAIFTPNDDGINDKVEITLDNPKESTVSGSIYDMSGAYIADLKWEGDNISLTWDGKDSNGKPVGDGVYLYQIRAEGKTLKGTVVVIK